MIWKSLTVALVVSFTVVQFVFGQLNGRLIKFKLSAQNLPNKDFDAASDPYVKAFVREGNRGYEKFGESSIRPENPNPIWDEMFIFQYVNGTKQKWRFLVKDYDVGWLADDHLGRVDVSVDDVVKEMLKNGVNGTFGATPIQMIMTQPKGGLLILTPILD